MGSKFLEGSSTDLTSLQNGTFALNVDSSIIQSLTPSLPVRSTADKLLTSGQIQLADCNFTPLTNPATSNLAMATFNILNAGSISGSVNSRSANDILSCATSGTSGNVLTFTGTAKVAQDSGTALSSLATTASLANYLQLAGGTMTGSINMGGSSITNSSGIDSSASLSIGTSSATSVTIGKTTIGTVIAGKGYVASVRPIMSGGFTMITPVTVANTTTESTLIGAGLGSLTVAANSASVGQSSHSVMSGNLSITGSPTLTIRLKGGPSGTTTLATFPITLSTIGANSAWKLTSDYTVKAIGAAGTASLYINSTFIVFDTLNPPTYAHFELNITTYDSTVINTLSVTAQWSAASASNTITSQSFVTNSVYTP